MNELKTSTMSRDEWLEERRKGIGGSDVAALLGLNPYKTPLALWEEKTAKNVSDCTSESAYWGTMLEDVVAKEFSKRTGMKAAVCELHAHNRRQRLDARKHRPRDCQS